MLPKLLEKENIVLTLLCGDRPGIEDFSSFGAYPDQEISCSFLLCCFVEWSAEHQLAVLLEFPPFLDEV